MSDRNIDYRVIRRESEDGSDEWYSIQEVYYDGEKPSAYTIDLQVEGDTITGMRTQLEKMLKALDEPVLDERDIVEPMSIEDRVAELEIENAELRDRLFDLNETVRGFRGASERDNFEEKTL